MFINEDAFDHSLLTVGLELILELILDRKLVVVLFPNTCTLMIDSTYLWFLWPYAIPVLFLSTNYTVHCLLYMLYLREISTVAMNLFCLWSHHDFIHSWQGLHVSAIALLHIEMTYLTTYLIFDWGGISVRYAP